MFANQNRNQPRRHPVNVDGFIRNPATPRRPAMAAERPAMQAARPTRPQPSMPQKVAQPQAKSSLLYADLTDRQSARKPGARTDKKAEKKRRGLFHLRRKHDKKRWSWKRRIITTVVLLIVVGGGLAGWDAWQLYHKVNHLAVGNLAPSVGGAENILIAGSTNRCNLSVQNAEWGFCSQGVTGVNSDIIMVVHIVPKTHTVTLLSIPRDTFVPNARSGQEAFKIDAALYEGPTQLVTAIEQDYGIPIQHYVEVGFDGFVNIVNAIGGVKMDFPMPVYDSESYLNVPTAGCKLLNGVEALQVVRARHLQYKPSTVTTNDVNYWPQEDESDLARITRTHEFLRVLASAVLAKGLSNPITDQKLVDAIAPQVQVDSGFGTSSMLQLMEELHGVNVDNVPQTMLPIATTNFGSYEYEGDDFGDVVFPVEPNDQQTINQFLGVSNSTDTMTGSPLPSPSAVAVNVVNGSGTAGQASTVSSGLNALGFNVVGQPGTATPVSDQAQETYVAYGGSSTEADAEAVARQLSGYVILDDNPSLVTSGSTVTVITGTGVTVNAPASSSSTSSSSSSSSSTSSSASSSSSSSASGDLTTGDSTGALAAPSASTQALAAWDPRACPSGN